MIITSVKQGKVKGQGDFWGKVKGQDEKSVVKILDSGRECKYRVNGSNTPLRHTYIHTNTHTHETTTVTLSAHARRGLMTEVWMTILESGWNLWVWLVGVVSRRWVRLVGGIYGYGYNV